MLRTIFVFISIILVWSPLGVNGQVSGLSGGETTSGVSYELYLPKEWKNKESLPMLVYLEEATDSAAFLVDGQRKNLMDILWETKKEFISVKPLFDLEHPFSTQSLMELVEEIKQIEVLNPHKIYLVSIFDGSKMLIETLLEQKEHFAAAAMISPRKLDADFSILKGYPILFVHGEMDEFLSLGQAWKLKDRFTEAGIDLTYSVVPYGKEDVYYKILTNTPIYNWLFSYPKE